MAVERTLLVIADIAGYTRFMRMHYMSLVHAQDVVAQLLEAVIDAAGPDLALAKLEGDAAFLTIPCPSAGALAPAFVARKAADIHRAFHARVADLRANTLCPCDGCRQAGALKVKIVAHVGDVATRRVRQMTELAGLDVIVVHRMLKNAVPLPEYLLATAPALDLAGDAVKARAAKAVLALDGVGDVDAWYVDLDTCAEATPTPAPAPRPRLPFPARLARHARLTWRSLPYVFGRRRACEGFRNVPSAPAATSGAPATG